MAQGIEKYLKLISKYAKVEMEEAKGAKGASRDKCMAEEGERLLKQAGQGFVLLDESGRQMTSVEFAGYLKNKGDICFVLGGAFGASPEVKRAAGDMISLSRMTLPHEMARLVFLEQLYRALNINAGGGYHH